MKGKIYARRFLKSCVYLTCWVLLILALMIAFSQTEMSFRDLVTTENGMWLWVFVIVFSLIHPLYGYCKRKLNVDATTIADAIDDIARRGGFTKTECSATTAHYRASSPFKKLLLQYEDEIVIRTEDGESVIEGPRKEVVKILFRIDTYMISKDKDKE